jgi:hypothetical protein
MALRFHFKINSYFPNDIKSKNQSFGLEGRVASVHLIYIKHPRQKGGWYSHQGII